MAGANCFDRKQNGSVRMCINLRDLNKNIIVDRHPLPNIVEMLSTLGTSCVFTLLDMKIVYHQVELHPDSRDYTAFITPDGCYRCKRMPFGLASSSSVFQRVIESYLRALRV